MFISVFLAPLLVFWFFVFFFIFSNFGFVGLGWLERTQESTVLGFRLLGKLIGWDKPLGSTAWSSAFRPI